MTRFEASFTFFVVLMTFAFPPAHFKTAFSGFRDPCQKFEIVTREEWLARPMWRDWRMKTPVNIVIIEHTVTSFCYTKPQCMRNVEFIQDYHMDYLGWSDIGYNFLVGGDGRIYEGKGWNSSGAHAVHFNTNSIGISFIGNFMEDEPSQKMLDAALNLISCGVVKGHLTPTREIHGHRDVSCTLSPGDKLYAIIQTWENFKGGRIKNYNC